MNRFRRLRALESIRALVSETRLHPNDFIQPFFVIAGKDKKEQLPTMPGINRYSPDLLLKEIEKFQRRGGRAGLFFGVPDKTKKTKDGRFSHEASGILQRAIPLIKKEFPNFLVITDVCLCGYMSHGHCGIISDKDKTIENDVTLPLLNKVALSHARAGADMVAPSDMMDFRVKAIRETLDKNNFKSIAIMSYAVKYASAFYGPFREVADCAPVFGDRKTYQMDPANRLEALKEAKQDVTEGADIIMVKPALAYLDVISLLRNHLLTPIAAYSVSGEYSMIKAAAQLGWIDERAVVLESLTSMKRAGANMIITYHAQDVLQWLKSI